jgi:5-methylcytosine-specific restriction protein A
LLVHGEPMTTASSAARGYGHKWQQAREQFLFENPLCAMHQQLGHVVEATVVDHKVPHRGDLKLFWSRSNWQTLCKQCHDSHKQRQEKSGRVAGCGLDGIPMDAGHHWRKG